jgi:phage terminase small subunit
VPKKTEPLIRHETFAQALAGGKTAAQAYVLAGYKPNDGNAVRLKANPRITARVSEILGKAAARVEVTMADIMDELRKIGFADIRKAVSWKGPLVRPEDVEGNADDTDTLLIKDNAVSLVSSDALDSDTAAAIAEVSHSPTGGLRIRLHNKKEALVALATLKRAAAEAPPADQKDPAQAEVPRATGADHLAGLARRFADGLRVIQGGAAPKPTGTLRD